LTSSTALRVALVVAALAAVIVIFNLFGTGFRVFCLVVIGAATLIALPERSREGGGWWWVLAAGAAASILGAIIAQPAETLGGWLALIGGLLVIVAAAIGFPREMEEDSAR
jgi:hypothetical protein